MYWQSLAKIAHTDSTKAVPFHIDNVARYYCDERAEADMEFSRWRVQRDWGVTKEASKVGVLFVAIVRYANTRESRRDLCSSPGVVKDYNFKQPVGR